MNPLLNTFQSIRGKSSLLEFPSAEKEFYKIVHRTDKELVVQQFSHLLLLLNLDPFLLGLLAIFLQLSQILLEALE